jgi:K+-sensing histidine kinase KdpD
VSLIRAVDAGMQVEAARWPGLHIMVQSDGAPPPAAADPNALAHALRNLISNIAWRAAGTAELEIEVGSQDKLVECRLIDRTGTLTEDDRRTLFELPTADPGLTSTSHGIAMYVAGRLIEAMRGRTWVTDREGGAVEIGFSLPCYEVAA